MNRHKVLPIPVAASRDANSFELISVWIANQCPHTTIQSNAWDDPAAWGIVLFDVMQIVASQYSEGTKKDRTAVFCRIRDGFLAEIQAEEGKQVEKKVSVSNGT